MSRQGIFVISIDTELAWGTFDHGGHIKYSEAYKRYRSIVSKILELFSKYEIRATWAIVGHLFLDACTKENGRLHPDIVRPTYSWYQNDWFDCDPGTDISRDDFWYGSDIVEMIKKAAPKQEIASHSFCHTIFSDEGCSRQTAESDIAKCVILARDKGIKLNTFVFPRNSPGHLDILSEYGFRVFRGKDAASLSLGPRILNKAAFLFNDMLPTTPPVVTPNFVLGHRLIEIKGSMLFRFAHGASRFIPKDVRLKKAKKGIERAIKEKKIFHIWLHPISFAWRTAEMFDEFAAILEYADNRRKEDDLEIRTLQEIGDMYVDETGESDNFNPRAVILHNDRSRTFKEDYSDDLSYYHSNAFKYGRKKLGSALASFLDILNAGDRVLEVGSGTGYNLSIMRKRRLNCTGIDLSENMVRQSLTSYPDIPVQLADVRRLPFPNDTFDAVVSVETLRYFSDREPFLKEIFRVVRPGGRIFITAAPLLSANTYGILNTLCRFLKLKSLISCYQSFETAGSLKRRLEEAGFDTISVRGYFFGPYFLLDKIRPGLSSFLMRRLEGVDDALSRFDLIRNFSNHLVSVARKPDR
ncbi:MAG: methyltransferase domain-containing protein [Candidatus Omnitrophota bacterium]|nr:methyltransferase domain-containing protein [Candidatus Omnitrophota bacterium]